MPIVIDHMSVAVRDQEETLEFYTNVFAGRRGMARGRIAGFWLSEMLELQFFSTEKVESYHYAFRLDPDEFDTVLERIKALAIPYGRAREDLNGELLVRDGSRSVFFPDPNGHALELITTVQAARER